MKRWPLVGLSLAGLWLFVRGVALEPDAVAGEFLIGLLVGLPTAFVLRRFYTAEVAFVGGLRTVPAALTYVALFLYELLTANLDVAYRVLAPSMPIEPEVIELPLRVQSDLAITTIANSISLTPGTLTMEYDEATNALYVHALDGRDRDAVVAPIRRWEDYALRIFDEPLGPSASVADAQALDEAEDDESAAEDSTTDEDSEDQRAAGEGGETDG